MKKLVTSLAVIATVGMFTSAQAAESCAAKAAALEKEISIAQQFGNTYKINGLKQALADVNLHCTSASVMANAQKKVQKLERKVAEKRNDIADVQADLSEAKAKGDNKKIAKYQRKLAEKQSDLNNLQQELSEAQASLAYLQK